MVRASHPREAPDNDGLATSFPPPPMKSPTVEEGEVLGRIRYEAGSRRNRGTIRYENGDVYEGEIKDRKRHGRGICRDRWGLYDGEWEDDDWHGKGTLKLDGGDAYEGYFKQGERDGKGVYSYACGDVYDGEWKESLEHGKGSWKGENGDVYEGNWVYGNKLGAGTFKWENGDVYEGGFIEGLRHGHGTMTWKASGRRFEGQWVGGKRHGKGTMMLSSGDAYEQVWSNGQHVKGWANGMLGDQRQGTPSSNATAVASSKELSDGRKVRSQRSQLRRIEAVKKKCEHCGVDDHRFKLRVCSVCNLALYCSDACQKAARGSHQRICDIVSELPSRDSDRLILDCGKETLVDLDAGLRYGTKYMSNLKHLEIDAREMASSDTLKLSGKHLSSLLRSKKGALDSVFLLQKLDKAISLPGISVERCDIWKELHDLKQLRLYKVAFYEVRPVHDIISQQKDTLMVLCLPFLHIDWYKAKTRRAVAEAVKSCKQLVKLDLAGCVLMDSDLKIMLQNLPNLRIIGLKRDTQDSHELTDNTCSLIARKCPGLQELDLYNHNHLSMRGVRKIFEGCPHLRAFYTSSLKLSCDDVRNLLDIAPQLMYLSLDERLVAREELDAIIEATGGRTLIQFNDGRDFYLHKSPKEGVSTETRERYSRQIELGCEIIRRSDDPDVVNEWAGMLEE